VQYERFPVDRFHQAGQLVLLLRRVDVRVSGVVEDPEQAVEANVDAGRLDQRVVERINCQPAGGDFGPEVAIGEQHATSVSARPPVVCLGNQLARQELKQMTKRIIDRLPDLRLAEGVPVPLRAANLVVGPESMPFVFTPSTRLGS